MVFQPFQGGSGLGMFIVHNPIRGPLKGEIRIDSEVGAGVVFTMNLAAVSPVNN